MVLSSICNLFALKKTTWRSGAHIINKHNALHHRREFTSVLVNADVIRKSKFFKALNLFDLQYCYLTSSARTCKLDTVQEVNDDQLYRKVHEN